MNQTRTLQVLLSVFVLGCGQDPVTAPDDAAQAVTRASGWSLETTMPRVRRNAKTATVGGVIYVVGGGSRIVDAYDAASKIWTLKKSLPEPLSPNGATTINGKIYVAGGFYGATSSKALYIYDPLANAWVRKANLPAAIAALTAHQGAINGELYLYGGITINPDGSAGPQRFFRYSPTTNSWATLAVPSYARGNGASGVTDGKFYMIGGTLPGSRHGQGRAFDVHSYDPATGKWTKKPLGATGLGIGLASATVGRKLYIVGVEYAGDGCNDNVSVIYDPVNHTLANFSSNPPLRYGALGAAAQGKFFLMGGIEWTDECDANGVTTSDVLAYTP